MTYLLLNIDGSKKWYINGILHRDNNLPAIEYANGNKAWYVNGDRRCIGGKETMIIDQYGNKEWYNINGRLHRDNDLPAVESFDGDKQWYINGKSHRDNDLPAFENLSGYKAWYENGKRHRLGGLPAIEFGHSHSNWFIHNKQYSYEQVFNYYKILKGFGRYCLKKIRMRQLRKVRWIHGELLCMPAKGSYLGGQDYHKMVSYFMSM
jgi:hypothetical protein